MAVPPLADDALEVELAAGHEGKQQSNTLQGFSLLIRKIRVIRG